MTIRQEERHHGVVILRLMREISNEMPSARFAVNTGRGRSSYSIKGRVLDTEGVPLEFAIGLFIKSSNKRLSPWSYSFHKSHQDELLELKRRHGEAFIVFVNGDDGIACVDFDVFKKILDETHEEQEWVRISRKPKQNYRVAGNDGRLDKPLPRNSFPVVISEYFKSLISDT
tara:strand:+ start:420 stop:935 length:516 start_codon:yes stop_codon:yes gene_type:complete